MSECGVPQYETTDKTKPISDAVSKSARFLTF